LERAGVGDHHVAVNQRARETEFAKQPLRLARAATVIIHSGQPGGDATHVGAIQRGLRQRLFCRVGERTHHLTPGDEQMVRRAADAATDDPPLAVNRQTARATSAAVDCENDFHTSLRRSNPGERFQARSQR
jgi:hypothetical protein